MTDIGSALFIAGAAYIVDTYEKFSASALAGFFSRLFVPYVSSDFIVHDSADSVEY